MLARRMKIKAMMKCEQCGRVTDRLAVHHIHPVENARTNEQKELLCFDENNLQVLCYDCHAAIHKDMRSRTKEHHQKREKERAKEAMDRLNCATFTTV